MVLIDEIDKADIEFPNDLLRELDRMEFYVYETRQTIKARQRPIIFITSNNEKELPDAFLRRCFFHYIRFPDHETMQRIIDVHFPGIEKQLVKAALEVFFEIREMPGLKKKPSTSELLDWLKLLLAEDIPPEALKSEGHQQAIPPLYGALVKNSRTCTSSSSSSSCRARRSSRRQEAPPGHRPQENREEGGAKAPRHPKEGREASPKVAGTKEAVKKPAREDRPRARKP